MNKFQKGLKFNSIEAFLDYLPEEELEIVEILRELILSEIPEVREKLSYNVPFYSRKKRICFIWPSSIPWGGIESGVALGFLNGHLLLDPHQVLHERNRKNIRDVVIHDKRKILMKR